MQLPLAVLFAFQQTIAATTPPSGDTLGYWQQEVRYRIAARLDEPREVLAARAELTYINNSPDTLREMYVHQHLNAFRPHSAWSAVDEHEGRVRFQHLADPDHAYERFTTRPLVTMLGRGAGSGVAVDVEYPGAPDSTVARLALPSPLAPGDSLRVLFEWEARPSTLPRRQGRRGRHYDFAQWYPRVAVYDRLGWRPNPLVPAGEFYGEFGTYDVTLVVRDDQVIGATGVPVEGDPGWTRARRWGAVHAKAGAYADAGEAIEADVPAGHRRVRFHAKDVHHFGWSTSPDYRYEGGIHVRPGAAGAERLPFRPWDTVAVHVLYQPGDEETWGNGVAVERTIAALRWLEMIFGSYAYPQVTNLHRIEGGGTEFPMLMMNGSASQGLILHELGHIYIHGILANNEWADGWMDEGFSSYQTSWAQRLTAQDRPHPDAPPYQPPEGYRGRAALPTPLEASEIAQYQLQLGGRAEPIGTDAHEFSEFGIYNQMIYTRASTMFGQLRDILGDEGFVRMLRGFYARWAFRHVDELALTREAERVHGADLGWFFDQWVHRTGVIDYELRRVRTERDGAEWVTRAEVRRLGPYRHPMPVGVETPAGWTIVRADPALDEQWVEIRTADEPSRTRLDPHRTTDDWDRRNDLPRPGFLDALLGRSERRPRNVVDWPFLAQVDRDRTIAAHAPLLWYSDPGRLALAHRVRGSYQGWIDRGEAGIGASTRAFGGDAARDRIRHLHYWFSIENPTLGSGRVLDGFRLATAQLDGMQLVTVGKRWDTSPFVFAAGRRSSVTLSAMSASGESEMLAEGWDDVLVAEGRLTADVETPGNAGWGARLTLAGGVRHESLSPLEGSRTLAYPRLELSAHHRRLTAGGRSATSARVYAGLADRAPAQRLIHASAADPIETFGNHWWRPRGAILKRGDVNFVPLGGGGLRGYSPFLAAERLAAANVEQAIRLRTFAPRQPALSLWASAFADAGWLANRDEAVPAEWFADAGVGLSLRGRLYDRDVRVRIDLPLWVRHPDLALDRRSDQRVALRWGFSFSDLW